MRTTTFVTAASAFAALTVAHPSNGRYSSSSPSKLAKRAGNIAINGVSGSTQPRLEVRQLQATQPEQWSLFVQAMQQWQTASQDDQTGYYQVTGIHGVPRQNWDGVEPCDGCGNADGYCTHDSVLFPAWHRTYVALFEQELVAVAQQIAGTYPASTRATMQAAASTLRMPYWDWAADPGSGPVLPDTLSQSQITINGTQGQETIKNPLYSYEFASTSALVYSPFVTWPETLRYPNTNAVSATSQENQAVSAFANFQPNLQEQIYQLMSTCGDYLSFSNDDAGTSTPQCANSLESIHNTVHGLCGGPAGQDLSAGHMTYLSEAGFDPIFWLHHANVDRYFALWQNQHPNSYGASQVAPHNTWTIEQNSTQDANSPLTPFHKNSNGDFWTTNDVRDYESTFHYTYPEFVSSDGSQAAIAGLINGLYGPGASLTAGGVPVPTKSATSSSTSSAATSMSSGTRSTVSSSTTSSAQITSTVPSSTLSTATTIHSKTTSSTQTTSTGSMTTSSTLSTLSTTSSITSLTTSSTQGKSTESTTTSSTLSTLSTTSSTMPFTTSSTQGKPIGSTTTSYTNDTLSTTSSTVPLTTPSTQGKSSGSTIMSSTLSTLSTPSSTASITTLTTTTLTTIFSITTISSTTTSHTFNNWNQTMSRNSTTSPKTTITLSTSSSTVSGTSSGTAEPSQYVNPHDDGTYQYVANCESPRYSLNGSYFIFGFNGEPTSSDTTTWFSDKNSVGVISVVAGGSMKNNLLTTGSIPLTRMLQRLVKQGVLQDMSEEECLPYLAKHFNWRIIGPDGGEIKPQNVPGFKVSVHSATSSQPQQHELPQWSQWKPHPKVTEDKAGGAKPGDAAVDYSSWPAQPAGGSLAPQQSGESSVPQQSSGSSAPQQSSTSPAPQYPQAAEKEAPVTVTVMQTFTETVCACRPTATY